MTRSQITNLLRVLSLVFIFLAAFVPTMPHLPSEWGIGITALCMALSGAATVWMQKTSIEIKNVAIWPTILFTSVGLLGGLADFFTSIPIEPDRKEQIRWGILAVIGLINATSKGVFPTYEAKVIEAEKEKLAS